MAYSFNKVFYSPLGSAAAWASDPDTGVVKQTSDINNWNDATWKNSMKNPFIGSAYSGLYKLNQDKADAASQQKAAQKAASDLEASKTEAQNQAKTNLSNQNSLEQQLMSEYRKRKIGTNLY